MNDDKLVENLELLNGTLARVEVLLGTLLESQASAPIAPPVAPPAAPPKAAPSKKAAPRTKTVKPSATAKAKAKDEAPPVVETPPPPPEDIVDDAPPAPPAPTVPPATEPEVRQIIRDKLVMGQGWSPNDVRAWLSKEYGVDKLTGIQDPAILGVIRDRVAAGEVS